MKMNQWSVVFALGLSLSAATASAATEQKASAKRHLWADADHVIYTPARGVRFGGNLKANLTYNGGPVISSAKVVFIFWGPSFSNAASPDYAYAQGLQAYRNQLGTTPEYNVITQYSGIQLSNLGSGTADWFDTSTPATNVTDALVQSKVNSYLASHTFDASAIYEVVIPSTSYSSSGSSTSCGGTNLQYCAYHGWIGSGASAKKYSIQPYPSCGGCQASGWTNVQNQEHFVVHETREAVTDPTGNGWTEGVNEADDKCNWTPAPFFGTGGYGYQYEWSNAAGACVQSAAIVASPTCGESTCVSLGGAYISHFTGLNCTGGETYYTPYFSSDGIRRSWDGNGIAGSILRTATNMSYKDSSGTCTNAWPAGNTLSGFVAVYRSGTPPGTSCGEASCVALGGAYISHFTGKNCTGTESYYTPYFSSDGIRRSWDGSGNAGTVLRTVTNLSYKDSSGTCTNAWPSGNTLSGFVLIYR